MGRCERFTDTAPDGTKVVGFLCVRGGPPPLPRAVCPVCQRSRALRDGRFLVHNLPSPHRKVRCAAAGKTPEQAARLAAAVPALPGMEVT